jgi:hypothetical protein
MRPCFSGGIASSVCMLCRRSASFTQDDADVLHHRQHHLAEALRLRLGAAGEVQLVQLADTVHQRAATSVPKHFCDVILRGGRVLDDIVQQCRLDGLVVQVQMRQDGWRPPPDA